MPESTTTSARSGNSARSDRLPPIALTVFRSVESNRSLRFSSLETLSWVILSCFAKRTCVLACLAQIAQCHFLGQLLRCARLDFLTLSDTQFLDLVLGVDSHVHFPQDLSETPTSLTCASSKVCRSTCRWSGMERYTARCALLVTTRWSLALRCTVHPSASNALTCCLPAASGRSLIAILRDRSWAHYRRHKIHRHSIAAGLHFRPL